LGKLVFITGTRNRRADPDFKSGAETAFVNADDTDFLRLLKDHEIVTIGKIAHG
jgi:hypothetical protein